MYSLTDITIKTGVFTRDSYHSLYGNQLFMYSRTYLYESDAKGNLIPMDQLPALTNSGFSPGMIAVVISEKIQTNLTYKSLIQSTPTTTNFVQATHSELQTGLETT